MMKQIVYFLAFASSASALSLTPDTWDEHTSGKSVFIKFFAPWCGHCKAMAGDWQKLMDDFSGHKTALVAEFDCTAEGNEDFCSEVGVQGFPTIKYGDPNDLEDYDGGRDYADLKAFADENLKPQCSVANIELCEGDKKTMIEKFLSMSEDELTKLVEEEEKKMEDARTTFETEVEKLQETYMNLQAEMENTMAEVKKGGLGMMKSVLKSKEVPEAKEEL